MTWRQFAPATSEGQGSNATTSATRRIPVLASKGGAIAADFAPVLAGGYRKGDRVELHSLKGAAEHNGKCGTVLGRQGERVQVRLDDAKTLALKTTNLTKLVAMPDAGTMRRAFAELSAAERAANAALPPGAGMENPCAFCGGARPHGKNDEFLPCCGVSVVTKRIGDAASAMRGSAASGEEAGY